MKKLLIPLMLAVALCGCASFDTNAFRSEQVAVSTAYAAYVGWTNYMAAATVTPAASNSVKQARLKFAASVKECEVLRKAYSTNSAVKPVLQSALTTLNDEAANLAALVKSMKD